MALESEVKIKFNADTSQAEKSLKMLGTAVKGVVTYAAIKAVADFTKELIIAGDEDMRMEKAFSSTAAKLKINADSMTQKLKSASRGLVEIANLQAMANKAMLNSYSPDEILAWTEVVTNYALSTGQNVSMMLDETFRSLAMGNQRALKQMGIDTKVVNGNIVADLKVLKEKAKEFGDGLGKDEDSPVIQMQKLTVAIEEFKGEMGRLLIGPATDLLNLVNETIDGWKWLMGSGAIDLTPAQKEFAKLNEEVIKTKQTLDYMKNNNLLELQVQTGPYEIQKKSLQQVQAEYDILLGKVNDYNDANKKSESNMGKRLGGGVGGLTEAQKRAAKEKQELEKDNNLVLYEMDRDRLKAQDDLLKENEANLEKTNQEILVTKEQLAEEEKRIDEETAANYMRLQKEKEQSVYRSMDATFSAVSSVSAMLTNLNDAQADKEIKNLDKLHLGKKEYDKRVAKIEAERAEQNRKYARMQQAVQIAEAIAATAKGIVTSLSGPPIYKWVEAAAVAAAGAAQVAVISSQRFQTGYIGQLSRSRTRDSIPAMIGTGETVISAPQTAMHRDLLQSIQNNTANTANGLRGMHGSTTYIFNAPSNEIVTEIIKNNSRLNRTGTPR